MEVHDRVSRSFLIRLTVKFIGSYLAPSQFLKSGPTASITSLTDTSAGRPNGQMVSVTLLVSSSIGSILFQPGLKICCAKSSRNIFWITGIVNTALRNGSEQKVDRKSVV